MRNILFAAATIAAALPAIAHADTMVGPRIEARVGYETPTVSDGSIYKFGNSATIGAEAGYDLAIGSKVAVGPFVNYEYGHSKDCSDYGEVCLESHGNLAAGGRIGFALGDKAQVYGKVGYDSFRLKTSVEDQSVTKTLSGVMGAIGVDFDITSHVYVGFEGDYADLGRTYGVNFARRHVAATVGTRF